MAYTTVDNPELYFQTKTYTGTGNDNLSITLDGSENMQPDWVWIKDRGESSAHEVFDSVRGVTKTIQPNQTNAEATQADTLKSFDSDGFTLGDNGDINYSGSNTYVAWNWKAGTSFSNDASATSVGTIDSTGSVSTTAGFSIISFTGQTGTVAHGLGVKPSMIILKCRAVSNNWVIQHKGLTGGMDDNALIFTTSAEIGAPTAEPTTSVFTVNNQIAENNNNIAYIFSDIKGYSKFGSYTGNGNADGAFVYTGFKPAWLLIKRSSASGTDWILHDNKRAGFNVNDDYLAPNTSAAEVTGNTYQNLDLLSNGFKLRGSGTGTNTSGATYIYMAFAESPFTNSNGIPNNAR